MIPSWALALMIHDLDCYCARRALWWCITACKSCKTRANGAVLLGMSVSSWWSLQATSYMGLWLGLQWIIVDRKQHAGRTRASQLVTVGRVRHSEPSNQTSPQYVTTDGWNKDGISMKQQLTFVARTSGGAWRDCLLTLLWAFTLFILSIRLHKNTPTMNFNKNILIALAMTAVSSSAFAPPQSAHRASVLPKKTRQSIPTTQSDSALFMVRTDFETQSLDCMRSQAHTLFSIEWQYR